MKCYIETQLKTSSLTSKIDLSSTKSSCRILACETEVGDLERKIEELQCIVEEESMQVKQGRNTIRMETKRLIDQIVQQRNQGARTSEGIEDARCRCQSK